MSFKFLFWSIAIVIFIENNIAHREGGNYVTGEQSLTAIAISTILRILVFSLSLTLLFLYNM